MSAPLPFSPPNHLLVIKPSSLGDIVHALQVIQLLRSEFPACRVTWVVRDRFAPLVESSPLVDEVILFHRKEGLRGLVKLLKELRQREFDMIWDMQGLLRSGLMTAAAHARQKWGRRDAREGARWFYQRTIDLPSSAGPHHAIQILLEFTKALGIQRDIPYPLALASGPEMPWSHFFAGDPSEQFVIFTDSRGAGKEWGGFDALTHLIWQKIPNSRIAWCAGSSMQPSGSIPDGRFLNLTGCPLLEMIELVRQPSIFIGNDSGPMHLSAALGNKVLAIFGPTSPLRFGPWPHDSPHTSSVQAPNGILANLSAEQVLDALIELREK